MRLRNLHPLVFSVAVAFAQQSHAAKDLAVISGRTVDADGKPMRKTTLTLRPVVTKMGEIATPYGTTSDEQGNFSFDGVDPAQYTLMAMHPGYLQQAYGSKKASNRGTILSVTAGQRMSDLTFTLTPQAAISGRVVDDEGDPVAGAHVRVMRSMYMNGKRQQVPISDATSDEEGEFKATGLAQGRYFLNAVSQRNRFGMTRRAANANDADKPDQDFVTTYYPGVTDAASAASLELTAGQNLAGMDIRLRKSPVFHVRGKVAFGGADEPQQRLQVMMLQRDARGLGFTGGPAATVAKDGSFELSGVAPGSYILTTMNMNGTMKALGRLPVDIANRNLDDIVLTMQPASPLRGSVKLDGQPAASPDQKPLDFSTIHVNLMASDGMFNSWNAMAKADGTFELGTVAAGTYQVDVDGALGGTYVKWIRYEGQDVLSSGLNVMPGGGVLEVGLSAAAGMVEGTVKTEQPQSGAGVMVTMVPDPVIPDRTYLNRAVPADQNGHFSFKDLAPGKYRVYAWEDVENGAWFDPEILKTVENQGTKITVDENGRQQISVPLVTAAQSGSVQ